jgi:DMSO reductase family type II enzyme heme b subunit
MRIHRVNAAVETLLDPKAPAWSKVASFDFPMVPTPLADNPDIAHVSPFLAKSTDHGTVDQLTVKGAHNGQHIAIRMQWTTEKHDKLVDLDQFVDGVAVMFPLGAFTSAFTMGAEGAPVNAWYWKANLEEKAFDVVAEGYGTSMRRDGMNSAVKAGATHKDGQWHVVLARVLDAGGGYVRIDPGKPLDIAFACWDGGNRERSGRKSMSGEFFEADVDA